MDFGIKVCRFEIGMDGPSPCLNLKGGGQELCDVDDQFHTGNLLWIG